MPQDDRNMGRAMSLGIQFVAGVGVGFVVGYWIDKKWNTGPWGLLIGLGVGLAAGMYQLIREGMRINKD